MVSINTRLACRCILSFGAHRIPFLLIVSQTYSWAIDSGYQMARRPAASIQTRQDANRKVVKQAITAVGSMAVIAIFALVSLVWYIYPTAPPSMSGPYMGTPTQAIDGVTPNQSFPIYNNFTLEVFDAVGKNGSPVVQLRDYTDEVQWAMLIDPLGGGSIDTLYFETYDRGWTRAGTVTAYVSWSNGIERGYFQITGSGELRDYWIGK